MAFAIHTLVKHFEMINKYSGKQGYNYASWAISFSIHKAQEVIAGDLIACNIRKTFMLLQFYR